MLRCLQCTRLLLLRRLSLDRLCRTTSSFRLTEEDKGIAPTHKLLTHFCVAQTCDHPASGRFSPSWQTSGRIAGGVFLGASE